MQLGLGLVEPLFDRVEVLQGLAVVQVDVFEPLVATQPRTRPYRSSTRSASWSRRSASYALRVIYLLTIVGG